MEQQVYGCLFCGQCRTLDLQAKCEKCDGPFDVGPGLAGVTFDRYTVVDAIGRGYFSCVVRAKDRIGNVVAIKLCGTALYEGGEEDFQREVSKYQVVAGHPNLVQIRDAGVTSIAVFGHPLSIAFIVMDFVPNSQTLATFLSTQKVTVRDVAGIGLQLATAVARLESEGLWHRDLHSHNVLLSASNPLDAPGLLPTTWLVRVVDLGSTVRQIAGLPMKKSDVERIGEHLVRLLEKCRAVEESHKDYVPFLRTLERLVSECLDPDPSRRITANDLRTALRKAWEDAGRGQPGDFALQSAFGFLNANQLTDEGVAELFSSDFPWLREVSEAENTVLVTGPRGCGKTMVLRSMRLRTHLSKWRTADNWEARRDTLRVAGLFVSARLSYGLLKTLDPTLGALAHPWASNAFLSLSFVREALDCLSFAGEHGRAIATAEEEKELCEFALRTCPETLRAGRAWAGQSLLAPAVDTVARTIDALAGSKLTRSLVGERLSSALVILDLWNALQRVRFFRERKVAFLLDDFSQPIVPAECQRAFLPVMFRAAEYAFVVSAHSWSVANTDLAGNRYNINREFREVNLGREYVRSADRLEVCERFLDDILAKRFASARIRPLRLRAILGTRQIGVGEEIFRLQRSRKLHTLRYSGAPTLLQLCTGDVSSVIDLLGSMVTPTEEKKLPVGIRRQNDAIRNYARREIFKLLDVTGEEDVHDSVSSLGERLHDIAMCFGEMSKEKIVAMARDFKGPGRPEIPEYLRIEVTLPFERDQRPGALSSETLVRYLLQYGVFVDGGMGSDGKGRVTQLLIFRKLFCPVFPTTLASRNSFSWTGKRFDAFLANPRAFRRREAAEEVAATRSTRSDP